MPLTLGTAGHIDHGKTALVKALTGTDTDRLAEEQRRGLSIELGFAELVLPGGGALSVVDVPGHERLIRTMVAGASGFDLFLLVVAADEGVMPQTREHLTVLEALGVTVGVIALTKCDRAQAETRALARAEALELLPRTPVVEVSAVTGEGLEELRRALAAAAGDVERRRDHASEEGNGGTALHVDRVFTLHGIGTVVTGTLWGGALTPGERVRVLPRGHEARVRSVQVHSRETDRAVAGQRVALNLTAIRRSELDRGDVVVPAASRLKPSYRLDVALLATGVGGSLDGERVQVHHGTRAVPARVVGLGDALAQLRLEAPLVARSGDRFVVRTIAPPRVVGGGTVLDPAPRRHGLGAAAERLRRIREHGLEAVESEELASRERERSRRPSVAPPSATEEPLDDTAKLVLAVLLADGAEPRSPGALAERLGVERREALVALDRLVSAGRAVRLNADVYFAAAPLAELCERAVDAARSRGEITLAELRDALGTSRKYAQALLEHLDASKVTVRQGDRHVLRRSAAPR